MVLSPIVKIEKDAKVAGLIDYDLMGWKVDMLNNLFSPQDADLIKSIPISIGEREDKLVWHYTKDRIFSVRNAYHLHREIVNRNNGTPLRIEERMVLGGQSGSYMSQMLLRRSFRKLVKMHSPPYPIC